jgi:predicted nuclease of predicted toxin-antitoxin system
VIRLLADADLNDAIVRGCRRREPAIDFLSANEANLEGLPDPEVLALAAAADRILVSHDFHSMPRHFGDFLRTRGSSLGLILVPQLMPIGEAIEELLLIWGASDAEEWRDRRQALPLPHRSR